MKRLLVYDWPMRFFHWVFALLLINAYVIAQTVDSDSSGFPYHMLMGLALAFVALLRVVWGFVGSRHARFSSFPLRLSQIVAYFKELFSRDAKVYVGHNPASSWTTIVMLLLAFAMAATGLLVVERVQKEFWEDVHGLLANFFLAAVIAHVGGVVFHMIKHRDALALSMVNGRKQVPGGETDGIDRSYLPVGLVFLALTGVFLFSLLRGYDQQTQALKIFGITLQLGDEDHGPVDGAAD